MYFHTEERLGFPTEELQEVWASLLHLQRVDGRLPVSVCQPGKNVWSGSHIIWFFQISDYGFWKELLRNQWIVKRELRVTRPDWFCYLFGLYNYTMKNGSHSWNSSTLNVDPVIQLKPWPPTRTLIHLALSSVPLSPECTSIWLE